VRRALPLVGGLVLITLSVGVVVLLTHDRAGDQPVPWLLAEEPSESAAELTIRVFVGNGCNEFKDIVVDESDDEVRLMAVVHASGAADCNSGMQTREVTVPLVDPLGQRELSGCRSRDDAPCSRVPTGE
jgi:hypothetical protein